MCLCRAGRLMQSFQAMLIWLHARADPLRLSSPHTHNQTPTVPIVLPASSPPSTQSQIQAVWAYCHAALALQRLQPAVRPQLLVLQ